MGYLHASSFGEFASGLGCGASCPCARCRGGGLGERYQPDTADGVGCVGYLDEPAAAPVADPRAVRLTPLSQMPRLPARVPGDATVVRVLRELIQGGVRDTARLTHLLFQLRHPERGGRPPGANEQAAVAEWRQLRDRWVRPALARLAPAGGLGLAECPGGGRLAILGQVLAGGEPIGKARVQLMELRDIGGNAICTHPRWPDAYTQAGGLFELRFQFDATLIPSHLVVRFVSERNEHYLMRVRIQPRALPRDSLDAFLDTLKQVEGKVKGQFRKKLDYLLKAARPSPEHLLWCGLIGVDLGRGELSWCLPGEGCRVDRIAGGGR